MGFKIKTKDGWQELPILSQQMPEEEKYKMEAIRSKTPRAEALVELWKSRVDSGEWPLKIK